ncbi:MAG: hypothetical protein ACOCP8_04380 [archaeon]
MTREIKFKIQIPDRLSVWEDANIYSEEEAFEKLGKEETIKFQEKVTQELEDYIRNNIEELICDTENFIMNIHENIVSIEDWDTLEDWGIKIVEDKQ